MTAVTDPSFDRGRSAAAPTAAPAARVRDIRLDFFRGVAMFIILMAHTPGNFFTSWIPARWGFSDATEIFVFCSGMASAIAFGGAYATRGWFLGTARVVYRVWQVYWAHIGLFFATVGLTVLLTASTWTDRNYWGQLNLWPLFVESDKWTNPEILFQAMTLQYVPNYFDILPMYMVILLLMPIVMALSQVNVWLVAAWIGIVWLFAQTALLETLGVPQLHANFSAESWTDREWFFNPFGWQLIFFTGFAFMKGWIPAPPVRMWLIVLAAVIVLANVPLSNIGVRELGLDWARDWRTEYKGLITKSDFGILRYTHFLALAYLCWVAAGQGGDRLRAGGDGPIARAWSGVLAAILKVGQQSLAVFVFSMALARVIGFGFDAVGRTWLSVTIGNLLGCAAIIALAYMVSWFKSQPWRARR